MKKISVIIPLYYGKKYIFKICEMVRQNRNTLSQNNIDVSFEVLFINDCMFEKIEIDDFAEDKIEFVFFSNSQNLGIHGSRVEGLERARGEYIHFLDQDDVISPSFYMSQLESIEYVDVVVCNGTNWNSAIFSSETTEAVFSLDYFIDRGNPIVSPGQVLIRKNVIPPTWSRFILKENFSDDYFLWILLLNNNVKFGLNTKRLFLHTITGENTGIKPIVNAARELCNIVEGKGLLTYDMSKRLQRMFSHLTLDDVNRLVYREFVLRNWLDLKLKNKTIELFFDNNGLSVIAIYGMGVLGKMLANDLKTTEVTVSCFVDGRIQGEFDNIPCVKIEDVRGVDAIIVTPVHSYKSIKKELEGVYSGRIISLVEVIGNVDCTLEI